MSWFFVKFSWRSLFQINFTLQLRCSFTFSGSQGQLIAKLSVFGWISVIIGSWKLNIHSKSGLCNRVLSDDLLLLPFAIILEWKFYIWTDSESTRQTRIGNWTSSRIIFAPLPIRKMNFSEFPLYSRRFFMWHDRNSPFNVEIRISIIIILYHIAAVFVFFINFFIMKFFIYYFYEIS